MYTLYVIPGSHACRSAMLMLEHKQALYRRVDVPTLLHPLAVRRHGFTPSRERRTAGDKRPLPVRYGDATGTVPALAAGPERITSNRRIARFLDERHPERPLLPADPELRGAVEEAERWGNDELQMLARRIALTVALHDFGDIGADGRMGYLLYRRALLRRVIIPLIGRFIFAVDRDAEPELLAALPPALDRIDAWIAEGVLGGPELNAADFMIAPSLALMLYRPDLEPVLAGRPALALVDRLLPAPA